MDEFQNKSQLKKNGLKELDPLLAPSIILRPRYELVLTGNNDRFQIGHEDLIEGTWNLDSAWRSFQQVLICIIIFVVFLGIIYWGIKSR